MCDHADSQKSSSYNNRRIVSMNKYEHETVKIIVFDHFQHKNQLRDMYKNLYHDWDQSFVTFDS